MPQPCEQVLIQSLDMDLQPKELDEDGEPGKCIDYLQFQLADNTWSRRYCGNETINLLSDRPISQFVAVFWTNRQGHYKGFDVSVTCLKDSEKSGDGSGDCE